MIRFPFLIRALALTCMLAQLSHADYKQAVIYYMQGRFDKAIQELKPDLDQNPDWESGHRLLGLCYLSLQNNALAISSLTRAVQLKSTAFSTYLGLGQANFNMQKFDNCIQILNTGEQFIAAKDAKEQESNRYKLVHLRGLSNYRLDKFNEAITDLTSALRIRQDDWSDFAMLGIAYHKVSRYDEAVDALGKALALKPGQAMAVEFMGKTYFQKGIAALTAKQYAPAITSLQKAGEFTPKNGFIFYNLAEAYLFSKNYAESEKALSKALEIMPQNAEVHARLGLVYEKQKKWDPALKAYKKAAELSPSADLQHSIDRITELKKK
jgi:tetratricopeptide (TPR) repeat protein